MRMSEDLKQYGIDELIESLGQFINDIQKIRNKLPVAELRGDARHVALSGLQTSIVPIIFSLKCISYTADNVDRETLRGFLKMPTQKVTYYTDSHIKSSLAVFFHFKIENLFTNVLMAFDMNYKGRGYERISTDFFNSITTADKDHIKNCIKVLANLRNGFHNEGIHRNSDFVYVVDEHEWKFVRGEVIANEVFDLINLLRTIVKGLGDIMDAPEIVSMTSPIVDTFNSKFMLPTDQDFKEKEL
jgi:hypothetical protein